jgi:hypothetical protein
MGHLAASGQFEPAEFSIVLGVLEDASAGQ